MESSIFIESVVEAMEAHKPRLQCFVLRFHIIQQSWTMDALLSKGFNLLWQLEASSILYFLNHFFSSKGIVALITGKSAALLSSFQDCCGTTKQLFQPRARTLKSSCELNCAYAGHVRERYTKLVH